MSMRTSACLIATLCFALVSTRHTFAQQALVDFPANPGGALAAIPDDPGNLSLVISQTQEVHEQIANVLEQLRRLQGMQVVVEMPFTQLQDDYFERIGVNFGFSIPGGGDVVGLDVVGNPTPDGSLQFRQGSFGSAIPPFGGFDPATQATLGFRRQNRSGASFDFNFAASQGSTRSMTTQAPVVSLMDGQTALVSDTSQMPFVTSVIPVVGGLSMGVPIWPRPTVTSPLKNAIRRYHQQEKEGRQVAAKPRAKTPAQLNLALLPRDQKVAYQLSLTRGRTAGHGDLSVAEIRRRKEVINQAEQQVKSQEIAAFMERGRGAEDAGRLGAARVWYQKAASRATGELKQQITEKIEALENN